MAVTIKHINDDASFLLSFEPLTVKSTIEKRPGTFRILVDPWVTGTSAIVHPILSNTTHKSQPCVASLADLPVPDIVIISQSKSDHCHEATLRQLPASSPRTKILAEPASAKLIRSWKYFDPAMVQTIPRWEDPQLNGRQSVVRIRVPGTAEHDRAGEVTIAFIPQKRDISSLHAAIGITYRPPRAGTDSTLSWLPEQDEPNGIKNPLPPTPKPSRSFTNLRAFLRNGQAPERPPPLPLHPAYALSVQGPSSPKKSLRTVRSLASISGWTTPRSPPVEPSTPLSDGHAPIDHSTTIDGERPLSLIFAPHGISYSSLHAYTVSHLTPIGALPLTALLHCFDSIDNPWWLGGNVLLGAPAGAELANKLGARVWISAHDGNKDVRGLATGKLKTRKWSRDEVEEYVSPRNQLGVGALPSPAEQVSSLDTNANSETPKIRVLILASGEEVELTESGLS